MSSGALLRQSLEVLVYILYLLRLDDLSSLHIDQLADCILYGVERTAITHCVETISISLERERGRQRATDGVIM
jgi:hypothetical protein